MPRNGSGTFTLVAGNPVVTGTTITSAWANATAPDIGSEITNSVPRDGQAPPTANLPMGGFRHTGAQNPVAAQDYVTLAYLTGGTLLSAGPTPLVAATAFKLNNYNVPVVLGKSAVQTTAANNVAENTQFTVTVPAGAMGANGFLRITANFSNILTTATTLRWKFGGTTFYSVAPGAETAIYNFNSIIIANRNNVAAQMYSWNYMKATSAVANFTTGVINTAVAQDLIFTIQKTTAGDFWSTESYLVEIIPGV